MKKTLDAMIDARQIVRDAGISTRPEFYSGRGATICDLGSYHLQKIYIGIEKNFGKQAGKEFVQMVADIPKLSATDFLLNLYNLEANGWK